MGSTELTYSGSCCRVSVRACADGVLVLFLADEDAGSGGNRSQAKVKKSGSEGMRFQAPEPGFGFGRNSCVLWVPWFRFCEGRGLGQDPFHLDVSGSRPCAVCWPHDGQEATNINRSLLAFGTLVLCRRGW